MKNVDSTTEQVKLFARDFFEQKTNFGYYVEDPYYHKLLLNPLSSRLSIQEETFFVGNGTTPLFKTFVNVFNKNKHVIGLQGQFQPFVDYLNKQGFTYDCLRSESYTFPSEQIDEKIGDSLSFIYIERPATLTGYVAPLSQLEIIIRKALQCSVPVLIDESYANYLDIKESALMLLSYYSNLVVLRSNAKGLNLGGLRTGIIFFGSKSMSEIFKKQHDPYVPDVFSVNLFAYQLQSLEDILKEMRFIIRCNKECIMNHLSQNGFVCLPSHPNVPILVFYHPSYNAFDWCVKHSIPIADKEVIRLNQKQGLCRIRIPSNGDQLSSYCVFNNK